MGVALPESLLAPEAVTGADDGGAADPSAAPLAFWPHMQVQTGLGSALSSDPKPAPAAVLTTTATATGSGAAQRSGSGFQSGDMGDLTPEMSPEGSPRDTPQRLHQQADLAGALLEGLDGARRLPPRTAPRSAADLEAREAIDWDTSSQEVRGLLCGQRVPSEVALC